MRLLLRRTEHFKPAAVIIQTFVMEAFLKPATVLFAAAAAAVDPKDDFGGYMEEIEERKVRAELDAEMYARHEEWRQTTWGGW